MRYTGAGSLVAALLAVASTSCELDGGPEPVPPQTAQTPARPEAAPVQPEPTLALPESALFHPMPGAVGLTAFARRETVLVWAEDGRVQAGHPATGWSSIRQLPMTVVSGAAAADAGVLIGGSDWKQSTGDRAVAVLVDEEGGLVRHWQPGTSASVRSVAAREDLLVGFDGDLLLFDVDQLRRLAYLSPFDRPVAWVLLGDDDRIALCHREIYTKLRPVSQTCLINTFGRPEPAGEWRSIKAGWQRQPPQLVPRLCGSSLLLWGDGELKAFDSVSGQLTSRWTLAKPDRIRCGGDDQLLVVAGTELLALQLPSLEVQWGATFDSLAIRDAVAMVEGIVCLLEDGTVQWARSTPSVPVGL